MAIDLYQAVTDKILAQMEQGTAPWVRPWSTPDGGMPFNAVSGKAYRGINVMLLWAPAGASGNGWMTYKQASDIGAQVRKGEKGSMIVFFKPWTVKDKNDADSKEKTIPVLRSFTVFHTSQIDNLPDQYLPKPVEVLPEPERIERAEKLMAQATVTHGGDRAYYHSGSDAITLPQIGQFESVAAYYATALHELTHWTGHSSRLCREYGKRFGDTAYAREELVAEMGAAFLCASVGIEGKLQHAEYLQSWIKVLRNDKRAIVVAAGAAQKAADFVLGVKHEAAQVAA